MDEVRILAAHVTYEAKKVDVDVIVEASASSQKGNKLTM